MIYLPEFDPVAIGAGPLRIRWYGLMYGIGFFLAWVLGRYRIKKGYCDWTPKEMDDILFGLIFGLLLGARLGYVLFYNPVFFFTHPLDIFSVWKGGMSFHGGVLGMVLAAWYFYKKTGRGILEIGDFIVPMAPPGLFFGRIGNFINAELEGRMSSLPWAVVYPPETDIFGARHPSQLYEACLEGIVLFLILWFYSSKPRPKGHVLGLFLIFYGLFRFTLEFFRQPDAQLGFIAFGWLTMGQLLCVPMLLVGAYLFFRKSDVTDKK